MSRRHESWVRRLAKFWTVARSTPMRSGAPLYPNCMVDITEAIDVKREAMLQFRTQVTENDFVRSILGLNAYRAAFHLGSRGYAEAFYRCRSLEFRRLCWHLVGRGS